MALWWYLSLEVGASRQHCHEMANKPCGNKHCTLHISAAYAKWINEIIILILKHAATSDHRYHPRALKLNVSVMNTVRKGNKCDQQWVIPMRRPHEHLQCAHNNSLVQHHRTYLIVAAQNITNSPNQWDDRLCIIQCCNLELTTNPHPILDCCPILFVDMLVEAPVSSV